VTDEGYVVVLVRSTNHALRAEKVLENVRIDCKLIPVPRQLSSDCGVCLRVRRADREVVREALEEAGVEVRRICGV